MPPRNQLPENRRFSETCSASYCRFGFGILNGVVAVERSAFSRIPSPGLPYDVDLAAVDELTDVLDRADQVVVDVVHRQHVVGASWYSKPPLKLSWLIGFMSGSSYVVAEARDAMILAKPEALPQQIAAGHVVEVDAGDDDGSSSGR